MHLVDTHCHVDLYPNYAELINETERSEIYTIAVTNTPSVFRHCVSLTAGKRFIKTALGLHPQLVAQRHHELGLMLDMLHETKYIGEVGLDFSTQDKNERRIQENIFKRILDSCADFPEKVLTIHSRRAAAEVVSMVGDSYPCTVILHWFSGSHKTLEEAIGFGFYFSVNSAMLTSAKGRQIVAAIPLNQLLTESDGPFVKIKQRQVRPSDIAEVVVGLAKIYGVEPGTITDRIYANFRRILTRDI